MLYVFRPHFQNLISRTSRGCSLKFFNLAEILPADCLTVLVNLVADSSTKATLVLKCLLLFNNLGKSDLKSLG